jgi:hypothetical protein
MLHGLSAVRIWGSYAAVRLSVDWQKRFPMRHVTGGILGDAEGFGGFSVHERHSMVIVLWHTNSKMISFYNTQKTKYRKKYRRARTT